MTEDFVPKSAEDCLRGCKIGALGYPIIVARIERYVTAQRLEAQIEVVDMMIAAIRKVQTSEMMLRRLVKKASAAQNAVDTDLKQGTE